MKPPALDRPHSKKGRLLPLRLILMVPFLLQIFAVVSLTGWLSLRNGQQAVNDLAAQLYGEITALIITELVMPVLDGFEMIRRIRTNEEFENIVIIVISASVFETDKYQSLQAGCDDFMPKLSKGFQEKALKGFLNEYRRAK